MTLFLAHVTILVGIYALVVLGLQLSVGRGRVLFVAPTMFFALGAYGSALLTTHLSIDSPIAAVIGTAIAWSAGYLTSLLALRLSGDHLLLATLGLCEITRSILNNWNSVTNGSVGVMNIPPLVYGLSPTGHLWFILGATVIAVGCCLLFVWRLSGSSFGHLHASLNGDEPGTATLGRRVALSKRLAIAWGSMWAGIAGSLYAHYAGYVDPTTFTVTEAVMILAMLIVGGMRHPSGAILGAVVFVVLPELLRFAGIPGHVADPLRRAVCGLLLLGIVRFWPMGLAGLARTLLGKAA